MNIIEAARLMKPGKKLVSKDGFTAILDDDGMLVCDERIKEPFGFYPEELSSDEWEVVDEGETT